MEQMQNSCLYMMQMVTAQKTNSRQDSRESTEESDFRKLMEQCGKPEQAEQPDGTPATQQTEEPKQPQNTATATETEPQMKLEPGMVGVLIPQVSMKVPNESEEEDELNLQMQELAAMQILCADQRIVVEVAPESVAVETVQSAVPEAVAPTAEQVIPNEVTNVETPEAAQPEQQVADVIPEDGEQTVEMHEVYTQPQQNSDTGMELKQTTTETEFVESESVEVEDGSAVMETPVFESVETAPVKVSETAAPMETAEAEPVENQIADKLTQTLASGETKVEVQLAPEHLGKVTIELTQKEDGSLRISIQAESSQTRSMLERDLSGLQGMLNRVTQQEVQVNVSQPQEQQQQQNYDGHQQQRQQQQHQQEERRNGEDFLNQLRLGLLTPEAEVS